MKFDVIIGNPPYQVSDGGAQASAKPVYHLYMQNAKRLKPQYISLIMPARFFTGGKGLDDFRHEMIHDKRFKCLYDYADSKHCFDNVDIKGGVCHFIWDSNYKSKCQIYRNDCYGTSYSNRFLVEDGDDIFIRCYELVSIKNKVIQLNEENFENIVSPRKPYGLHGDIFANQKKYGLPPIYDGIIKDGYKIYGLDKLKRVVKYIPKNYPLTQAAMLEKYKIFVTRNYGCGEIGEIPATPVLATPVLATPGELCTETFIQIGPFDTEQEMKNCFSYFRTKFFRCMVGIRKQDQGAPRSVYRFVPLQDFTPNSDIDWSKSIHEIDLQLYQKYGLDETEINFIETHVKEMP